MVHVDHGLQGVLDEYGLTVELLDPSYPVALLSSLAATVGGGAELLEVADRAIGTSASTDCLLAIVVDYAGICGCAIGSGSDVCEDDSVFDVWVVGREATRSFQICSARLVVAERRMTDAIETIISDADIIG